MSEEKRIKNQAKMFLKGVQVQNEAQQLLKKASLVYSVDILVDSDPFQYRVATQYGDYVFTHKELFGDKKE